MARRVASLLSVLVFLYALQNAVASDEKNAESIEKQYQAEKNPRKRVKLALELLDERLRELHEFLDSNVMLDQSNTYLPNYLRALDSLSASTNEAAHAGTSKNVEMHLREHVREFENIKMRVSAAERPQIEKVLERLESERQRVLYGLMKPRSE